MKNLIRSIYMGCLLFALQTPVEAATIEEVLAYCRAQAEADERPRPRPSAAGIILSYRRISMRAFAANSIRHGAVL